MRVDLNFETLDHICRVYAKRGENFAADLGVPISEALHAEVLEVFETEGYGRWPRFWWERRGLPKPGTPKSGPVRRGGAGRARDRRLLGRGKLSKSNRRWVGTPKLLQDTGVLIGSLTPFIAQDMIEVYTNVPYAKYHVSPEPRHVIPLRDFFDVDRGKLEQDVASMIEAHLDRPLAAE